MVWPMVAVAVASAVYGAVSTNAANKRNAKLASEWAQYNAAVAQGVGRANAQAANDFAAINAAMVMMGART